MTRQTTNRPNNAKVPLALNREQWKTLIPFLTNQLDHIQSNLIKGRLRHRIVRHIDNVELINRLQSIENALRAQFYFQGREENGW